jgi:hypothetical protein
MNKPPDLIRRSYDFFIARGGTMQSPLLLGLRLYFFWHLFLIGKGKLANIEKKSPSSWQECMSDDRTAGWVSGKHLFQSTSVSFCEIKM